MATEDILIRYRADVSQLEADLNKLVSQQEDLLDATKEQTAAMNKSVNAQAYAAKKRADLIEIEKKKILSFKDAQKLAFDPKVIEDYNKKIAESGRNIETLQGKVKDAGKSTEEAFNKVQNTLGNIAGAFGVAFSLDALVNFSKTAIEGFAEAEKSAKLLESAIVKLGGESSDAFNYLNQQAEIFDATSQATAEDIKAAQIELKNYGLSASQIADIIPSLLGLAKQTGDSLQGLASKIGNALEGSGKQFKNLGANIDTTKTQLENYNELLRALSKYAGDANLDLNNTTDAMIAQQRQIDEMSDSIGEKIAPAWLKAKNAVYSYISSLLNIPTQGKAIAGGAIQEITAETQARVEQLKKEGKSASDIIAYLRNDLDIAQEKSKQAAENLQKVTEKFGGIIGTVGKLANAQLRDIAQQQLNAAAGAAEIANTQVAAIQQQIGAYQNQIKTEEDLLSIDYLKKQNLETLNKLLNENQLRNDLASQSNVKNIEKVIEALKKSQEEAKKAAEEQRKQLLELQKLLDELDVQAKKLKIQAIDPQSFDEAIDKINQLKKIEEERINADIAGKKKSANGDQKVIAALEKVRLKQLEVLGITTNIQELDVFKKITDAAQKAQQELDKTNLQIRIDVSTDEVKAATDKVAKAFEDLDKSLTQTTGEAAQDRLMSETDALNRELKKQAELRIRAVEQQALVDASGVNEFNGGEIKKTEIYKKAQAEKDKITRETNAAIQANNQKATDAILKNDENVRKTRIEGIAAAAQEYLNLFNDLSNLYKQFSDTQISEIEKVRDAQLAAIDESLKANDDAYKARAITEREAVENERQLQADRVKAEEEAQKKIREIKRKQAILDKAAALVSIAINTAVAVSKITAEAALASPFLIPLIIAQGAAQAAAVIAQPIPYRKGSKDTGRKGHMARVGEEGEEIVYMPQNSKVLPSRQTRKYGEVIDAMFDNNLDKYINKHYITPALVAQKRAYEGQQSKNFADNMAQSIYYNQTGLTASDLESQRKRGQYIRNVDELANAIAKHIPKYDPYRA